MLSGVLSNIICLAGRLSACITACEIEVEETIEVINPINRRKVETPHNPHAENYKHSSTVSYIIISCKLGILYTELFHKNSTPPAE